MGRTEIQSTYGENKEVEISVVLPCFNEEKHIISSLKTVASQLSFVTDSFEIIVVDDGSRDETWELLLFLTPLNNRKLTVLPVQN